MTLTIDIPDNASRAIVALLLEQIRFAFDLAEANGIGTDHIVSIDNESLGIGETVH